MQPTTVLLDEATQRNLQALAEQQGKTIDEIMQEAIQLYFVSVQKKQPKSIGLGKSNLTDLSERVDELIRFETVTSSGQAVDRRAFMKLPIAERRRILAEQAEAMAEHYEQDSEWREWTNFDVGEIYDEFQTR
jgi:hypothetical protein